MGTTQRIGTGVKNQPNWGNLTTAVSSAAKAVSDLEEQDAKEQPTSPEQIEQQERRYVVLSQRRDAHIRSAYKRLVTIGGGSKNISSGKSTVVGRAGLKSSNKLASFFSSAGSRGLEDALKSIGFLGLAGKTVREVIDFLVTYCGDSAVGMDETASNQAINEVLRQIEAEAEDDLANLEGLFREYTDSTRLAELLCQFFGVYIFEYLSERLDERLQQMKGEQVARETFDHIKKDIMGRVERLNQNMPVAKIDWAGQAGKDEIERIFEAVIKIEE
jgi:hypothetical protein